MRSFILTAAIAATLASLPLTAGFAKSDPSQTSTASGTHEGSVASLRGEDPSVNPSTPSGPHEGSSAGAIHTAERAERSALQHQADPAYPGSSVIYPIYRHGMTAH
jgi:hypothetical protein